METRRLYVYFDLESTGLSRWHDRITQIGATAVLKDNNTYKFVAEFETFVKADKKIHISASEKTGIYDHHLINAPDTSKALKKFFEWLINLRNSNNLLPVCLVAYNGFNFDFPMFMSELHRWDYSPYLLMKSCGVDCVLDPLIWARRDIDDTCLLRKSNGKCSFVLSDLHTALIGNPIKNAHQALSDTRGLMNVCIHEKFKGMELQIDSYYCQSMNEYLNSFSKKRQSIDNSVRKNVKNKIRSIFDMQKKEKLLNNDKPSHLGNKISKVNIGNVKDNSCLEKECI